MLQATSIRAYEDQVVPKLSEMQSAVYRVFKYIPRPDFTDQELNKLLDWGINRVTPRRGELAKKKLIIEAGERRCAVTGSNVTAWRIATPAAKVAAIPAQATLV